jgi:hypothetical protein
MTYFLQYDNFRFSALENTVKGYFENPRFDIKEVEDKLFFSGWFIAYKSNFFIKIKYSNGPEIIHYLTIDRPDVLDYFGLRAENIQCGFQFEVDFNDNQNIFISVFIDDVEYIIWKIIKSEFSLDQINSIKNNWLSFHVSEKDNHLLNISRSAAGSVINTLFSLSTEDLVYGDFFSNNDQSFKSLDSFKSFILFFQDPLWTMKSIEKAVNEKYLKYELDYQNFSFTCVGSYAIGDFNYLCFDGPDFQFYVVQHNTNVLLAFPSIFRCINLGYEGWARAAMNMFGELYEILNLMKDKGIQFPKVKPAKFFGVNLSQSRPYHYFYDNLFGLDYLCSRVESLSAFSITGLNFIDPKKYFKNIKYFDLFKQKNQISLGQPEVNCSLSEPSFFSLMPCLQYKSVRDDKRLADLSRTLIIGAKNEFPFPINLTKNTLVFWVSISVEKRCWLEQEEGIISIVKLLQNNFENIVLIVDGMTSALNAHNIPPQILKSENLIFDNLERDLPGVTCISLIGHCMPEKISYASAVNIFLTSYGTDSLYVSCINEKKGVVYAPPSIRDQRLLHVHKNVIEIPDDKIKEINPEDKPWHEVNVSIDWRDVYNCLKEALNEFN